jgi:hypothetical protein
MALSSIDSRAGDASENDRIQKAIVLLEEALELLDSSEMPPPDIAKLIQAGLDKLKGYRGQ